MSEKWEPQPLATLRASTACTGKTLPLLKYIYKYGHAMKHIFSSRKSMEYFVGSVIMHCDRNIDKL
jgi:hypothetical protein